MAEAGAGDAGASAPGAPLPPYAFVSPRWPHPRNHPGGHSYGAPEPTAPPLEPERWQSSPTYLRAIELFNCGYYWEAHEGWEALWHAAGREGPVADLLKALIKLAAAGVKVRQHSARGIRSHAERALGHVADVRAATGARVFCGFDLDRLESFCRWILEHQDALRGDIDKPVEVVFEGRLELVEQES